MNQQLREAAERWNEGDYVGFPWESAKIYKQQYEDDYTSLANYAASLLTNQNNSLNRDLESAEQNAVVGLRPHQIAASTRFSVAHESAKRVKQYFAEGPISAYQTENAIESRRMFNDDAATIANHILAAAVPAASLLAGDEAGRRADEIEEAAKDVRTLYDYATEVCQEHEAPFYSPVDPGDVAASLTAAAAFLRGLTDVDKHP
jgi:hypothetical protein